MAQERRADMKLQDFDFSNKLRQETTFLDLVSELRNILNLGRYQMRVVTSVPDWTGEGGEHLLYISGTVRRFYWYDDTNSTWEFIEWNNSGLGQATIAAIVSLTGQTGNIATTTIYTPPAAGLYRVSVYQICSTAGSAGTLNSVIGWTDIVGAKTISPAADVTLTSTANGATGNAFINATAAAITYAATITGGAGGPAYALYIVVEKLQ